MYLRYLNFEFFEIRPHPSISLALELYAVAVYSRRAALVYEKHSCLVNCIYLYVLVRTFQGILYSHVPVCTGTPVCTCMYRYVPVHTILPDPVQVYRIPDGVHTCFKYVCTCYVQCLSTAADRHGMYKNENSCTCFKHVPSGFLPPTMSYVTYDIVRPDVRYCTSGVGHRTSHCTYDIVCTI